MEKLYNLETDFTVVYFTGFGVRRSEGASHCLGVENVEQLDAKGLLDLNLNPLNILRSALNLDPT